MPEKETERERERESVCMWICVCQWKSERERERDKKKGTYKKRERAMFALFYLKGADWNNPNKKNKKKP